MQQLVFGSVILVGKCCDICTRKLEQSLILLHMRSGSNSLEGVSAGFSTPSETVFNELMLYVFCFTMEWTSFLLCIHLPYKISKVGHVSWVDYWGLGSAQSAKFSCINGRTASRSGLNLSVSIRQRLLVRWWGNCFWNAYRCLLNLFLELRKPLCFWVNSFLHYGCFWSIHTEHLSTQTIELQ